MSMTFALCCLNKFNSRMATNPLSVALGYAMEVAVGSGDIVRMAESDFTDECGFGSSIRVLGA
jgi:hypothetical protein